MPGRIEEFDGSGDWSHYVERIENFFVANGIEGDEKQRAVFLSVIGAPTYRILRNLLTQDKPSDKPYKDLLAALSQHFHP